MDGTDNGQVRTPRLIGIIGKLVLNAHEKEALVYIGRCIALLGHTLVIVPAKGTADAIREGIQVEGGETRELETGVIDTADHTLVYPDKRLLSRLLTAYPDIKDNANEHVTVIAADLLDEWVDAMKLILIEKEITPPQ